MAERFGASVTIDRPIEQVFAFLADGENDKKFSARVVEISKATDGPPGKGTIYKSTVKDAGLKTKREFELTEFEPPTRIRWTERSKNLFSPVSRWGPLAKARMTSRGRSNRRSRRADRPLRYAGISGPFSE